MRQRPPVRPLFFAFAVLLAVSTAPVLADGGKVARTGAFTGPASDAVKQVLDPQGYRVTLSDGTADIWLRKDLPGLEPCAFVGVVTFPAARSDFRGQTIKAGTYTLRYARMPADGNHMGAAPTSDFLLLVRVADDGDPAANLTWEKLTELSKNAAATNHPAPLNLGDASSQKEFPGVATNDLGHEVFFVKLKMKDGSERPIGVVLKGRTEHE
jgi:hypothetical protein